MPVIKHIVSGKTRKISEQDYRGLSEKIKGKYKIVRPAGIEKEEESATKPSFKELKDKAKALGMTITNTTKKAEVLEFLKKVEENDTEESETKNEETDAD